MSPYSLFRDRLFLFSCVLYAVNRWMIKRNTRIEFFHTSLNDLLCFPIWIPILVTLLGFLHLRTKGSRHTPTRS